MGPFSIALDTREPVAYFAMVNTRVLGHFVIGLIFIFSLPSLAAEKVHVGEAFAFYIENDTRLMAGPGSDQAYSNGIKISYVYAQDQFPEWSKLPARGFQFLDHDIEMSKLNFGLSLGHQIYTPNNTRETQFISDDRPYAGWLYLGFALSFREDQTEQFFEVDVGTIGPSALGKEVQNNFHDLIRDPRAEGWSHSLHDEPTLQFSFQKRFKTLAQKNVDFIPYYGTNLGNVQIAAYVGGLIRLGNHLPDNFGPGRPSASDADSFITPALSPKTHKTSAYAFAGARGKGIVRNIFLDGNSFRESPRVKKYPFIFETEFGFALQMHPVSVVWSFVTRSPEFEERSVFNSFASLSLLYLL